jgi:hypothetical protein
MKKGYHKQPPALFTLDRSPQPQIPEAMEDIHRKQEVCYEILTHVPRHFGITINLAHHRTTSHPQNFPPKRFVTAITFRVSPCCFGYIHVPN